MGKTGAWILLIRLLYDHLRSSQGVTVESLPMPVSMFLLSSLITSPSSSDSSCIQVENALRHLSEVQNHVGITSPPHSKVVPLELLLALLKNLDAEDSKNDIKTIVIPPKDTPTSTYAESSSGSVIGLSMPSGRTATITSRHVVSIPVSQYMAFDFAHSCNDCSKYTRGNPQLLTQQADFLTFNLPSRSGKATVSIRWCVPFTQQKHCVISPNRRTLERLKLPTMRVRGNEKMATLPMTPVFTPTLERESCGLFNLFHGHYYQLHVLVTCESEFESYCKAWPNHIVMALPDKEAVGLGKVV